MLIKRFFFIILFVFISSDLFSFDYEKKINDNFNLSEKINKEFDDIKSEEEKYIDKIAGLKLRLYILKRKKESFKKIDELNKKEIVKAKKVFFEKKKKEYIKILNLIENNKKNLPAFIYKDFLLEKKRVYEVLNSNIDFKEKIEFFLSFLEKEIDHSSSVTISYNNIFINKKKYQGKLIVAGDLILLFHSEKDLFIWNQKKNAFETIDKKRKNRFDDILKNIDSKSPSYPFFIRKFLL